MQDVRNYQEKEAQESQTKPGSGKLLKPKGNLWKNQVTVPKPPNFNKIIRKGKRESNKQPVLFPGSVKGKKAEDLKDDVDDKKTLMIVLL